MQYSIELEVDVPCSFLVELYENPENLSSWQREISGYSLLSGEQGQVGSRMRLTYNLNQRSIDVVRTITVRDIPNDLSARYEGPGLVNYVTNRFAEIGPASTFWRVESRFEFSNFVMKLIGYFMPHVFRDQTWKYMTRLKQFAESEYRAG